MKKIGIISDTHSFLDQRLFPFLETVDEIWHAGDIGSLDVIYQLENRKPLRAVFGNIDNYQIRQATTENLIFEIESLKVLIRHIGGYPKRYNQPIKKIIEQHHPELVICGHSHILKVMYDHQYKHLHINPGAIGNHGFHKLQTAIRMVIDNGDIKNLEILELDRKGAQAG